MNLLKKLIFLLRKPKIVVVAGSGREVGALAVSQILKQHFKVGDEVLIFETDLKDSGERETFKFLVKNSSFPILIVTHVGEFHPDREFFAAELNQVEAVFQLAEALPDNGYLILNFDDETVRDIRNKTQARVLTFGFGARADFRATDISIKRITLGTNFKINYQGSVIPIWLNNLFGKEQIYTSLAAAAVGRVLDLNLVEISEALKNYQSLPGKMQLIEGIKNSLILDDSENASPLSMVEALEILRRIESRRRIAVLGDIVGVGKYTIEAHESIGERVKSSADILFTVGSRAKFFARGAIQMGMPENKIFQFDELASAKKALQEEIREGDLVLVDGSKEMEMGKIVEEIKFVS